MFAKSDVNGDNTNEVYRYLRRNTSLHNPSTDQSRVIPWNFSKFIVNSQYANMQFFDTRASQASIKSCIEEQLALHRNGQQKQ